MIRKKRTINIETLLAVIIGATMGFFGLVFLHEAIEISNSEKLIRDAERLACSPGAKAHLMSVISNLRERGRPMTKDDYDFLAGRLSKFPKTSDCLSER